MPRAKICSIAKNEELTLADDGAVTDRTDVFFMDVKILEGKHMDKRMLIPLSGPEATNLMFVQADGKEIEVALSPKGEYKGHIA